MNTVGAGRRWWAYFDDRQNYLRDVAGGSVNLPSHSTLGIWRDVTGECKRVKVAAYRFSTSLTIVAFPASPPSASVSRPEPLRKPTTPRFSGITYTGVGIGRSAPFLVAPCTRLDRANSRRLLSPYAQLNGRL